MDNTHITPNSHLRTLEKMTRFVDNWQKIENILRPLHVTDDDYRRVMDLLLQNMVKGLGKATNPDARVKMYPTYVRSLPDGTEAGDILALDLGGTNFRVLLIRLDGQEVTMESKIFLIPQHIMLGTGKMLFDHIVDCIAKFMKEHNLIGKKLPLGFTFSFPCKQLGLNKAILTTWTKGFKCEGVEGRDIVELLHEAVERREDIDIDCVAVINDTVGALMSCAHSDRDCRIGIILGTGSNACYVEDLKHVEIWDEDKDDPSQVIINMEWGAFGDDGCLDFLRTDYDKDMDRHSLNPGKQLFEKMISGMYMGEVVRLVLEKMRKSKLIFNGKGSEEMSTRGRFFTKYVSEIESDVDDGFKNTKQVFEDLNLQQWSIEDCRITQYVCSLVSSRAAFLSSAGVATLLNRINKPDVSCAVDGSLYRFHPHFHDLMVEKIGQLIEPGLRFKLMLSHDGSGKGAAIVASVAARVKENNVQNNAGLEQQLNVDQIQLADSQ